MSGISAICLSDLHFGYWGSVLTAPDGRKADTDKISPVLESLVDCIEAILGDREGEVQPKLVLAGDVLELSLATTNVAASVFAQFLGLLFRDDNLKLDRSIVYLPGNHDHHLWELAREQQYTDYLGEPKTKLPFKNPPWHATHLFPWREGSKVPNRNVGNFLLDIIAGKFPDLPKDKKISFLTMYPNFGIMAPDGGRCTVIHHGHFTESIYYLMTELRRIVFPDRRDPSEIWDIEAENFAWIDFLWGSLGRSASVGDDVGLIYELLNTKAGQRQLVDRLARNIPKEVKLPWWVRPFAGHVIKRLLTLAVKRLAETERGVRDGPLSEKSQELLDEYIGRYVEGQLQRELGDSLPEHVNFIFGHTHKPFEEVRDIAKVERPVHVYNSGGWVVDSIEPASQKGGAIVVVDEDGNTASIHMYNESGNAGDYAVKVMQAGDATGGGNPLYESLSALVKPDKPPWSAFSAEVAKAVVERQEILKKVTGGQAKL